jgi:LuxR family maltose regulon positive regulatory protein
VAAAHETASHHSADLARGLARRLLIAGPNPAAVRVIAGHVAALLATTIVLGAASAEPREAPLGVALFLGFSALRIASVRRNLQLGTIALDAVGTAVFLAGTGAPSSPHFFLALAGAWWAAHLARPQSGLIWAVVFVAAYGPLVVPEALRDGLLVHALEDASVVVILALLSDWFVRVDRRALNLSEAVAQAPAGAESLALREGLRRALGPLEISIDVLVTAGEAGLTVIQAELLAYLALGLTNQQIADATNVSDATVRYRLTRLYRSLGVRGRGAAVTRARGLGLALPGAAR